MRRCCTSFISSLALSALCVFPLLISASGIAFAEDLKIERADIQRVEDGHPVFPPDSFAAGETIYFSFYVEGYTRKEKKSEIEKETEVKLSAEAKPVDAAGVQLVPVIHSALSEVLTQQDKHWQPKLRGSFRLPDVLSGGSYRILLSVKDEFSGASTEGELPFRVAGQKIEVSKDFQIRNLNFYANDEDERPLDISAYRISEEIHTRFEIAGFSRGEQGGSDVVYGFTIVDAGGQTVFTRPSVAEDKSEEYYPKPYIPASVTFSLKPGTPGGDYTLIVTAIDKMNGDRKAEARRGFRLE